MKNFTSLTGKGSYCTGKGSYRASGERISKCLITSSPPGVACRRRPRGVARRNLHVSIRLYQTSYKLFNVCSKRFKTY